jgi:hypothetical protein
MDPKLILLTGLFLLSLLLFYGLPEDRINPALTLRPPSASAGDPPSSQQSVLVKEVGRLRQEQARLHREINRLHYLLVARSSVIEAAGAQRSACTDERATDDSSGITVYLETTGQDSKGREPQWTAVSFRDAGVSPDGSRKTVLAIHKTPPQRQEPTPGSWSRRASWQ